MDMRGQPARRAVRGEGSLHVRRSGQGFRRLRRVLALSMVLPAMVAVGIAPAQATHVQSFEIDGNTPVDTEGNLDWETTGTHVTDPVGNADTSTFTEGSKEFDNPSDWVQGTGTAPAKDDITDVYTYSTTDHDGHVWAYFGFRRFAANGTVNYDVEFNQEPNSSEHPARPTRTPGDLMVRFEQDGNNDFILTEAYIWTLKSDPAWDEGCIEVPGYDPAAGWCPTSIEGIGFDGATSEDGLFAEGSFDLTALFGDDACRPAFGTMNIRSFAGESNNSALKDYVAPIPIHIPPSCWEPIGITNVAAASYDVSYDWSVDKSVNDDRKTVASGANATFTYRVLLTAGDQQRSGHELGGTVTLTNPNGSPMVATLSVTATTGTGCGFPGVPDVSADAGHQVDVPDGQSIFVYTCTSASPPANGSTTATVEWDEEDFPSGTEGSSYEAMATAGYTWMVDQSTDEQTTVTDTFHGGAPQVLGTFTWADVYNETDASTPPHTVVVATYTRTITAGAAGTCASYVNTARQTENDTGQSTASQETVTVCAAALEVLPTQAFGSVGGKVSATCQGTVRAKMRNGTRNAARFMLKIGDRKRHFMVRAGKTRRVMTTAPARTRVVLKARGRVLDRAWVPARCAPPEVLPATGLRAPRAS